MDQKRPKKCEHETKPISIGDAIESWREHSMSAVSSSRCDEIVK